MNFELFIARRIRLRRDRRSAGTVIAVTGIAVAFVVMLLSIAVMLGFKHEIKQKIMGFDSQIIVYPPQSADMNTGAIVLDDSLRRLLDTTLPEARVSLTLVRPVIFKTPDDFQGMILRGLGSEREGAFIAGNLVEGSLPTFDPDSAANEVVVPAILARRLGLEVGEKLQSFFVQDENVKVRNFKITGVYDTHFTDYDRVYAFVRSDVLQKIAGVDSLTAAAVSLTGLGDDAAIDRATERLREAVFQGALEGGKLYQVRSVHETGAAYFSWLSLLDTNVTVILILMAIVSGFTLVSSLFIIILERVNMIGILKALGATNGRIRRIFIYVAERLVLKGLLIGNVVGCTLIALEYYFHIVPLDPESYYLTYVPVEFSVAAWIGLNVAVVLLSALILILPTHIIATIKPSRAIRYD